VFQKLSDLAKAYASKMYTGSLLGPPGYSRVNVRYVHRVSEKKHPLI